MTASMLRFAVPFGLAVAIASGACAQAADHQIVIDETQVFQQIDGFGASMTDSAAYLLYGTGVLDAAARETVMQALFDPSLGIGLSYLRQPIGTSDFRHAADYTYDDMPAGQTDYTLQNFSIAGDMPYIVPALLDALRINPDLKIMGSPWSPPAWMKDSGALGHGRLIDSDAIYEAYADYFVKYIQAYAALGIEVHAVTMQNEPHYEPGSYPGMRMERAEQSRLVQWLGPKFQTAGIATKIIAWDHNWDEFNYPIFLLHDQAANPFIDGSAFHCYAGNVTNQSIVQSVHPDKGIYFTECSGGGWAPDFGDSLMWDTSNLVIGATRNWAKTVIKWNIALDQDGGPKIEGGCSNCRGVVTIDKVTGEMTRNAEYYALGHASRFVQPGASRIGSSAASGAVENVAFQNADGSFAALVLNAETSAQSVELTWRGQSFTYALPVRSVVTFTWPNAYNPPVAVWMTTADQTRRLHHLFNVAFTGGSPPGDLDGDADVDLDDHGVFVNCLAGPQVPGPPANCAAGAFAASDLDGDGDVDAGDFAQFQPLLGGS